MCRVNRSGVCIWSKTIYILYVNCIQFSILYIMLVCSAMDLCTIFVVEYFRFYQHCNNHDFFFFFPNDKDMLGSTSLYNNNNNLFSTVHNSYNKSCKLAALYKLKKTHIAIQIWSNDSTWNDKHAHTILSKTRDVFLLEMKYNIKKTSIKAAEKNTQKTQH